MFKTLNEKELELIKGGTVVIEIDESDDDIIIEFDDTVDDKFNRMIRNSK